MAFEHNFKMVEKCLGLVESIYDKGTAPVKNTVKNIQRVLRSNE